MAQAVERALTRSAAPDCRSRDGGGEDAGVSAAGAADGGAANGHRVMYFGRDTKKLQEQLFFKDVPFSSRCWGRCGLRT